MNHWPIKKLGEVCEVIAGQSPPGDTYRKQPEGLPFFQGKADFGSRSPIARTWCVAPKKIAERGDILMSVRAPVGPTNIADVQSCIGRGLAAIRPREGTDRDFVYAFLKFHEPKLVELGSGSTFAAIDRDDLDAIEIPLPSLSEQKRIVKELDAQMGEVERMRAAVARRLEAAHVLSSSFLRAVFDSPESRTWPVKKLGEFCKTMSGGTPTRSVREYYEGGSIPWLRSGEVAQGDVTRSELFITKKGMKESSAKLFPTNTVLVAMYGATAGQVGLLKFESSTNQAICGVLPTKGLISRFLFHVLKSKQAEMIGLAGGGAQPNISQAIIRNLQIPIPLDAVQRRIVAKLDEQMANANVLVRTIESESDAIAALPAALLREVFE